MIIIPQKSSPHPLRKESGSINWGTDYDWLTTKPVARIGPSNDNRIRIGVSVLPGLTGIGHTALDTDGGEHLDVGRSRGLQHLGQNGESRACVEPMR